MTSGLLQPPMPPAAASPGAAQRPGHGRGTPLQTWIRALDALRLMADSPEATLASMLDDLATRHGDAAALLGEGGQLSFRGLAAQANSVARWAAAEGVAGQAVALLMPNRPAYVATWLGLTRAGCTVALVNTNLTGDALAHSILAASASSLIVDGTLLPAITAIAGRLPPGRLWAHGPDESSGLPRFAPEAGHSGAALDAAELPFPRPRDVALLIYTSGTTGLPKGAKVTHGRILEWSLWFAGMMDVRPDDRLYDCLPMYHSVGGVVAVGAMLVRGGSVLVSQRFSASRFWDEVVDGGCTIVQYIGELCRYLTLSAPHPRERGHRLRLACGNGLQGGVWQAFQDRFGIPHILEFYAATEGSVSLYNCEGRPGAIGRVPPFLAHRFPVALIRCDPATGEPLRDAAGRCIPCDPDEAGEAVGRIDPTPGAPARHFDGYTDADASARKVLHGVFTPGDRWFRTGDLMRKDPAGFYSFVDRVGDTFRWKGENVSTTEVAAVLQACPGVSDAVAYGILVPGHEGRACMAAVTTGERFDFAGLWSHLAAALPGYARPLFVRVCQSLDLTSTFKLTRTRLAAEGYTAAGDPVWFSDRLAGRYVPCDQALLDEIAGGLRRL